MGDVARSPLVKAATERIKGERPGPVRALIGAAIAGGATSVLVYRLLRQ
jgi:hypothetical protein